MRNYVLSICLISGLIGVPAVNGNARANESALVKIKVPVCTELSKFSLSNGDRSIDGEVLERTFGLKVQDWSDLDINAFKEAFFGCKKSDERFMGRYEQEWFLSSDGPVEKTAAMIIQARADTALATKGKAEIDRLVAEIRKIGSKPLTETDKADLKRIAAAAERLSIDYQDKGLTQADVYAVHKAIGEAERAEAKRQEEGDLAAQEASANARLAAVAAQAHAATALATEGKAEVSRLLSEVRKIGSKPLTEVDKAELKRIASTAERLDLEYRNRGWAESEFRAVNKAVNEVEGADDWKRRDEADRVAREASAKAQAADQENRERIGRVVPLMSMYRMSSACAEKGVIFTKSEVDQMLGEMKQALDTGKVSQADRDEAWKIVDATAKMVGFDRLGYSALKNECQSVRNTLVHAFPKIFMSGTGRPNPF